MNVLKAGVGRRDFLAGAAAAAALTIVKPGSVHGAEAARTLELGLIGAGGRGNWIANLFQANGWKVVAVADYFADRANGTGERLKVDADRRFSGLNGHKKLLEGKLDAVAIETPPFFHPQQAADAIDAGKHVLVAKPIAVDVPGCLTIAEAGRKATEKKLAFLVDFQSRANTFFREAVKWVHDGNVGQVVLIQANYFTGPFAPSPADDSAEARLRAWFSDKDFSGDIIVEQNIHALDIATWFLNADPISAVGKGGNALHTHKGTCWDHFAVLYHCPGDVIIDFSSSQCTKGYDDIGCRVFARNGTADTHYGGNVVVRGDKSYRGGNTGPIFTEGCVQNIRDFHRNITEGNFANETVAPSVRSNLTCILGREAAYKKAPLTWAEMMKEARQVDPKLEGLKA
ncbi:MAG TPA: Gfo/Idh/MocA family oxidoreductase [Planctomycetota bacterium]|nr:Gfo/Idh/MocA family oxidoreductase [Planctomycetota bacterium]HRR80186.1 Gfo/Idh/MocA family oxidoreductase [Planctomycetota bacterium]HRT94739.1 Gfo/Idh/MocA family oxidoreductase [Planctomycetota bacterium]